MRGGLASLRGALVLLLLLGGCGADMPPMDMPPMDMTPGCPAGQVRCDGACVDPMSSPTFCGATLECAGPGRGAACGAEQVCSAGACVRSVAALSELRLSAGALSPPFAPDVLAYTARVPSWVEEVQVIPTAVIAASTLRVNGTMVASGATSPPLRVMPGMTALSIEVTAPLGQKRSYAIAVQRSVQPSTYLKASNTDGGDAFGSSLSLSGGLLAVGAPFERSGARGPGGNEADNAAVGAGAVYLFRRTEAGWAQEAYLKASNTGTEDRFGFSVSLSGDALAVGAPYEASATRGVGGSENDETAPRAGAVYLFRRTGASWRQEAYVKASNAGAGDEFGRSVSLAGDRLAVGAPGEDGNGSSAGGEGDNSAPDAGAAYLFQRTGATWAQVAYLKPINAGAGDLFGHAVSLSGESLAVGAPAEASNAKGTMGNQNDNSAPRAGAAYVFRRIGAGWRAEAYLKASNTGAGDELGWSVSLSGDLLAVGARFEDGGARTIGGDQMDESAMDAGAVYMFRRSGSRWSQEAYLKAANADAGDQLGGSLCLSGSLLAVGAPREAGGGLGLGADPSDGSAADAGGVYLFRRIASRWSQEAYLKASNTDAMDQFSVVSVSEEAVAVGAPGESSGARGLGGSEADNTARGAGAVYFFR